MPWCEPSTAWKNDQALLDTWHERLRGAIESFEPDRLGDKPGKSEHTFEGLIQGVAAHDVYHAGQIRLLWRMMEQQAMVRIPTDRAPTHPGEMLLEEFLNPMGLTQRQLADAIRVPYQRVNEIVNGRRGMSPSTALRVAKLLGTSVDFWLNLQQRGDLYSTLQKERQVLDEIQPLHPATT